MRPAENFEDKKGNPRIDFQFVPGIFFSGPGNISVKEDRK